MTVKEYLQLLKSHDWHFDRSDDSRVYNAGLKERNRILSIATSSKLYEKIFTDWMLYRACGRERPTLSEYEEV